MGEKKVEDQSKQASKQIRSLMREGKFREAIKIASSEEYEHDKVIQSQAITAYTRLGMYEEAKKIADREEFQDKKEIYTQRMVLAVRLKNVDEAVELLKNAESREGFIDRHYLESCRRSVNKLVKQARKDKRKDERKLENQKRKKELLQEIATKIYSGKITPEDFELIETSILLSEHEKTCIKLAIYDKQNDKIKSKELFRAFKQTEHTPEETKLVNKIMQRINSNKKKIYDYEWYARNVGLVMDENLLEQYRQADSKQKAYRESLKVDAKQEQSTQSKEGQVQKHITKGISKSRT